MDTRQKAVEHSLTRSGGQPDLICAECGGRLIRSGYLLACGREGQHTGMVKAPSTADYRLLHRLRQPEDVGQLRGLDDRARNRLAFLVLRLHNWDDHGCCHWLAALGAVTVCTSLRGGVRPICNLWGKTVV
jgi:hypothetical protein